MCGADFHANLALWALSTQVRPRTKAAVAKWTLEAEAERALWGRKRLSKNTWTITLSVAILSILHLVSRNLPFGSSDPHSVHPSLPAFFPPSASTFSTLASPHPCPQPTLATIQAKHHQPPADNHQHLLFWVTFSPVIKNRTLSQLPYMPQPSSYILANLRPGHPTRYHAAPSGVLSIPCSFSPFPTAKISCCPLPHPQRAYKFRVSNLFMDSLSVQ